MNASVNNYLDRARAASAAGTLNFADMGPLPKVARGSQKSALRRMGRIGRMTSGGTSPSRLSSRIASGNAQAFVKVVRGGGAKSASQMKAQMAYLTRNNNIEALRSARYFNAPLLEEEQDEFVNAWAELDPREANLDKTTHLVISYPKDVDEELAEKAARCWAEELLNSGQYSDVFDYYTTFHNDTDHPHMHLIVNRRGLEVGEWLKVSKRGVINYDLLRDLQVETASSFGIELEATPRFARGLHDRPPTDAEIRRSAREGRQPNNRPHTEVSAHRAAIAIWQYAEQFEQDAQALRKKMPGVAEALHSIACGLKEGKPLDDLLSATNLYSPKNTAYRNDAIDAHCLTLINGFEKIDLGLLKLPEGMVERASIERHSDELRSHIAPFLTGYDDHGYYAIAHKDHHFRGFSASDEIGIEIKSATDKANASLAEKYGFQGALMVARYGNAQPVSAVLAERWINQEQKALIDRGIAEDQAALMSEQMHSSLAKIYNTANEWYLNVEKNRHSIQTTLISPQLLKSSDRSRYQDVKEQLAMVLTTQNLAALEQGDLTALKTITQDPNKQNMLFEIATSAPRLSQSEHSVLWKAFEKNLSKPDISTQFKDYPNLKPKQSERKNESVSTGQNKTYVNEVAALHVQYKALETEYQQLVSQLSIRGLSPARSGESKAHRSKNTKPDILGF